MGRNGKNFRKAFFRMRRGLVPCIIQRALIKIGILKLGNVRWARMHAYIYELGRISSLS